MFVFELPALVYQELDRATDWRHAQTSRVGARPADQFLGPGDDTITLTGSIPLELGDRQALETLREMGDAGEAYPLVDGTGKVHGAHKIRRLSERQKHVLQDGTPRLTEFTLELFRTDDPAQPGASAYRPAPAGQAGQLAPAGRNPLPPPLPPANYGRRTGGIE